MKTAVSKLVLQNLLNILLIASVLLMGFFALISAFPDNSDLIVREELKVSSAPLSASGSRMAEISGVLRNRGKEKIQISSLKMTAVSSGKNGECIFVLENLTLVPGEDCSVSSKTLTDYDPDTVSSVEVTYADGSVETLRNPYRETPLVTVLFALAAVFLAVAAVNSVRKTVYLVQEIKMD